eukprot:5250648-Pyramimonas_sp.AAC.1
MKDGAPGGGMPSCATRTPRAPLVLLLHGRKMIRRDSGAPRRHPQRLQNCNSLGAGHRLAPPFKMAKDGPDWPTF